jgi:CBS domain containing-hemolysin-like protein
MTGDLGMLLVTVVLLGANAFFVGASFALVSARRSQIEPLAAAGSKRAKRTLAAMEQISRMMAAAQLGITVCSVALGALAEPAVAAVLEGPLEHAGLPHDLLHPVALTVSLTLIVLAHVLLGEMVPKNFTLALPNKAALALGPPLAAFARAFTPFLKVIEVLANLNLKALRISKRDELSAVYGIHEVAQLAEESHREGLLDDAEYGLMARALAFTSATAKDVAIPFDRLETVSRDATGAQVEALAGRTRHLRFPVLDTTGRPIGYVHAKDLLRTGGLGREDAQIRTAVRPMPSVAAATPLPDVLSQLRASRAPMAVVEGPNGAAGVITLDDVIVALIRAGVPAGSPPPGPAPAG